MIYISVQPDDFYFTWQLEIQLRNFRKLNIPRESVQVLVGYNEILGVKPLFREFINKNRTLAEFYVYPDKRQNKDYISSIRPNILKQHFSAYPELENEIIFYHDSDVLFSRIPELDTSYNHEICYVSDTRSYLDSKYIKNNSSYDVFKSMAEIVGISTKTICDNDQHAGGAQYVLKGINSYFWDKVERDSQMLYSLLKDYNRSLWIHNFKTKGTYRCSINGIQAWCADMWAVLWNLWYFNKNVEIHPEMNFSWPDSPIENWKKNSMLHYSGEQNNEELSFKKTKYVHFPPWHDESIFKIPDKTCSYEVTQSIISRRNELDKDRYQISNVCFILFARCSHDIKIETLNLSLRYLSKHFDCDIKLIVEDSDKDTKTKAQIKVTIEDLHRTLTEAHNIEFLFFYPIEYIIGIESVIQKIEKARTYPDFPVLAYEPSDCFNLDPIFTKTFSMVLDDKLLSTNVNKFGISVNEKVKTYCISYRKLLEDVLEKSITYEQLFTKLDNCTEVTGTCSFYKLSNLPKNYEEIKNGIV